MPPATTVQSQFFLVSASSIAEPARENAEKLLEYLADINLEKNIRIKPMLSGSVLIAWQIEEWEFEIECLKNGYFIYTFSKNEYQQASGCERFDDFIPQFEKYLLML